MRIVLVLIYAMLWSSYTYQPPTGAPPPGEYVIRERWARMINEDELYYNGSPTLAIIYLDFFSDANYLAVTTYAGTENGCDVWYGFLYGIQYSYFHIVNCGGYYFVHAGSPLGIYEASRYENLYRLQEVGGFR